MCDRTIRLRKAILRMTAIEKDAPLVTPQQVKSRWLHLSESGSTPYDIAQEANSDHIDEERFKYLMSLMNSYL
jgi:hypothetical protein